MNVWAGVGRLTGDPDIRSNSETLAARFTVACDRRGRNDTADFIPCVAFGKTAEFIEKYFKKGMRIGITGRIQTGSYTNKEGKKVYTTDIIAEQVEFVESKSQNSAPKTQAEQEGFFTDPLPDEGLPFGS